MKIPKIWNTFIRKPAEVLMFIDDKPKCMNRISLKVGSYHHVWKILILMEKRKLIKCVKRGRGKQGIYYVITEKGNKIKTMFSNIYNKLHNT